MQESKAVLEELFNGPTPVFVASFDSRVIHMFIWEFST